jgi:peptide deformylase
MTAVTDECTETPNQGVIVKENAYGKPEDLELLFLGVESLTKRPEDFNFETEGDKAADLAQILYAKMVQLKGVGLSANQVGIDRRVFVVGSKAGYQAIFNPMIVGLSKETCLIEEACLSLPGLVLTLRRPTAVTLSFQDVEGKRFVATYDGLSARVIQHEYDHMEGCNFTMLASPFKVQHGLNKLRSKHKKLERLVKRIRHRGAQIAKKQAVMAPFKKKPT